MKRQILSLLALAGMLGGLAGCGSKKEGKVLNIWCWNDEFEQRFNGYYPDIDFNKTKITDTAKHLSENNITYLKDGTEVHFVIHANDNNGYQIPLDAALKAQEKAKADDKIDMFLLEADYAIKYVNSDYTLDVVKDLGLTESDLSQMYGYTKTVATDTRSGHENSLKGVSWQATPGLYAFRSDLAAKIWADYPADDKGAQAQADFVQTKLGSWDKFDSAAVEAKAKNVKMVSGYDDTYRVFSNNASAAWVDGNKQVNVDAQIKNWVKKTKDYADKGYCGENALWSDGWAKDQSSAGNVLGFFYSTWGINFTLAGNAGAENTEGSLFGKYRVCEGPASYYWGGTWMAGCKGTDNKKLVKDIMLKMTCDKDIAKKITLDTLDYTNNKAAMKEIADDTKYGSKFLGGQNHIKLFSSAAEKIKLAPMSAYDQGCNEKYQQAMRNYFNGSKTFEEANTLFEEELNKTYNGLTYNAANKTL